MNTRKIARIIVGVLFVFVVAFGLISINHPIILKWLTGTARIIGRPITATVYTNGKINPDITIFHVSKYWDGTQSDYYILQFPYSNRKDAIKLISINRKDNYVGIPSSTNKKTTIQSSVFYFKAKLARSGSERSARRMT